MYNRGFTMLEILVSLFIIGLLSSVIMLRLGDTRAKANDAALIAQAKQIFVQAEAYYLKHESFGTTIDQDDDEWACRGSNSSMDDTMFGSNALDPSVTDLVWEASEINPTDRVFCAVRNNTWAFAVPLQVPEPGTTGWCVDSSGNSKAVNFDMTVCYGGSCSGGPTSPLVSGNMVICP